MAKCKLSLQEAPKLKFVMACGIKYINNAVNNNN